MIKKLIIAFQVFLIGCDVGAIKTDAIDKTEWSILQSFELKYRERAHAESHLIFKNALDSGYTVIAFPIKDRRQGYAVMLTNSDGSAKVKIVPNVEIVVAVDAYDSVKRETKLSTEIDTFILARVK
jgi:hypothetical protein